MSEKILFSGNEVMGEAAIQAGCSFYAGYPITPQNELTAYMAREMPQRGGVFIQSESEIAAINMIFGASAAGARVLTSSSSPGISLKQEGISYFAGANLPGVIINVMRAGPGLGNIWPAQSDYFQATKGGGHGDYRMIVLAPWSVQEAYQLTRLSFDLADEYRIMVMVLADGILGQMMEPVVFEAATKKRIVDKPWALTGAKNRKQNIVQSLFLRLGEVERNNIALQKKYRRIAAKETRCEGYFLKGADVVIVAYGSISRIAKAAVESLRKRGHRVGLMRPISLWPFPKKEFLRQAKSTKKFFVVEMSYGQMVEDVALSVGKDADVYFYGRAGGGVPSEKQIEREAQKILKGNAKVYG